MDLWIAPLHSPHIAGPSKYQAQFKQALPFAEASWGQHLGHSQNCKQPGRILQDAPEDSSRVQDGGMTRKIQIHLAPKSSAVTVTFEAHPHHGN